MADVAQGVPRTSAFGQIPDLHRIGDARRRVSAYRSRHHGWRSCGV